MGRNIIVAINVHPKPDKSDEGINLKTIKLVNIISIIAKNKNINIPEMI